MNKASSLLLSLALLATVDLSVWAQSDTPDSGASKPKDGNPITKDAGAAGKSVKKGASTVFTDLKKGTEGLGHELKKGAKMVGTESEKAVKGTGKGVSALGHKTKEGAEYVGGETEKGAKAVSGHKGKSAPAKTMSTPDGKVDPAAAAGTSTTGQ